MMLHSICDSVQYCCITIDANFSVYQPSWELCRTRQELLKQIAHLLFLICEAGIELPMYEYLLDRNDGC